MDIYELLRNEHTRIRDILASIKKTGIPALLKKHLIAQLHDYMLPHLAIKETIFYTTLQERDHTLTDNIERAKLEFKQLIALLEQFQDIQTTDQWEALFAQLEEKVEAHFDREETELFSVAESNFSREEAVALANQVKAAKRIKAA